MDDHYGKLFKKQFSKYILFTTHIVISEKLIKVRQKQIYYLITVYIMTKIKRSSNLFFLSHLDLINFQFGCILIC